jgi:hypothetical protein
MKVLLLSFSAVVLLPDLAAGQPGYIREAGRQEVASRYHMVQETQAQSAQATRIEAEYRFPLTLSMTATGYQNGQKREENVVVFYLNPARGWVAMPSASEMKNARGNSCAGLMVYDITSSTMLMLNTRAKTGSAMHMAGFAAKQAEVRRNLNLPTPGDNGCTCSKTGRKKVIEGFRAEEYSCTDRSRANRHDMWVTRELKTDLAPPGSRSPLNGFLHSAGRLGGIPLEAYYYEGGNLKSSLMITDVNRSAQFFVNTEEYRLNLR